MAGKVIEHRGGEIEIHLTGGEVYELTPTTAYEGSSYSVTNNYDMDYRGELSQERVTNLLELISHEVPEEEIVNFINAKD